MAMNIDLKNLNMSDIQDQIKKLTANKKLVTKIGIIFGAIVFFLIIYYAVLNPMVNSRKAKLDDMNKKKQETEQFTKDINSMKAKIKKLKPEYENYSKLFHSKAEVEGLYQTLSVFAGRNDLVISKIVKKPIESVLKSQALAKASGKKAKKSKKGKKNAEKIVAKHRLIESFLVQIMGFNSNEVHLIAEEIEHINSPVFFRKVKNMLNEKNVDPHGSSIPDIDF